MLMCCCRQWKCHRWWMNAKEIWTCCIFYPLINDVLMVRHWSTETQAFVCTGEYFWYLFSCRRPTLCTNATTLTYTQTYAHTCTSKDTHTHTHPHRRKMGTYDISTTFEDTAFQRDYRKNKLWSVLFESHTSLWGQVLFWSLGDTNRTQSQTHTHKSESADILGLTIYDCKILG